MYAYIHAVLYSRGLNSDRSGLAASGWLLNDLVQSSGLSFLKALGKGMQGSQELPRSWSHIPARAMVPDISNRPQNHVCSYSVPNSRSFLPHSLNINRLRVETMR